MDKNEAKIKRLLALMDEDTLTKEDFVKNFEIVIEFIKKTREYTEDEMKSLRSAIDQLSGELKDSNSTDISSLKDLLKSTISSELEKFKVSSEKRWSDIQAKADMLRDGIDADEEIIVDKVLGKIKLPEYKETVLDTPEQLRDKLESIEEEEDKLSIEAIKGWKDIVNNITNIALTPKGGGGSGGVEVFDSTGKVGSGSALKFIGSGVSSVTSDGHTSTVTISGGGTSLTVQDIDGSPTVSNVSAIKFTNGSVVDNGDGTVNVTTGAGGGGDVSSNTATSVDSEVVLFSGTGGKTIKRATGTGIATLTSGVLSATATTGSGSVVLATTPTLTTPVLGVATATSVNKVAITAPATSATLTIADGATLTASATASVSGTNTGDNAVNSLYSGLVSNATHTGDATGATTLTLATVNSNVGTFGSATQSSQVTVNAKGLVTAVSGVTVTPAVGSITGLGTGVATALGVNVGTAGAPVVNGGALGTPSSGTLTNATGLPISTGVSGLGTGVATFLATASSANLATAVTDETGSGALVFATSPTLVTPILGTPTSGTLTNCTGLPVAGITSSTSTALGLGSVELGHASDTTLSRSSAGVLAVEGVVVPTISSTNTITNKRITKRTGTTTSSATPTINTDNVDFYSITAQTVDITSFTTNLSGTPTDGQTLWIAITGTGARAITWGSSFEASTVALPTTTVSTNRLDVGFVWNTITSKWRCVSSA